MKHIIQLSKSGPRIKIAFSKKIADHFGPVGTAIAMNVRRVNDRFIVWLRRDYNSRHKMHTYQKRDFPFCVDITSDNPVFNEWPDTQPMKPIEVEVTLGERFRLEFHVSVGVTGLQSGSVDTRDMKKSLEKLKEKLVDHGAGVKTIENILSTQPQPQATPIPPVLVQPEPPVFRESDSRGDFLAALSAFNKALCPDINDIELTVERLNEEGNPVEVIKLPPPSLMRIRGRVIREEIFE